VHGVYDSNAANGKSDRPPQTRLLDGPAPDAMTHLFRAAPRLGRWHRRQWQRDILPRHVTEATEEAILNALCMAETIPAEMATSSTPCRSIAFKTSCGAIALMYEPDRQRSFAGSDQHWSAAEG
jgi:hypothetical protein